MTDKTPRVTYKDIMDFQEKVFGQLAAIRKENTDDRDVIREDLTNVRIELGRQDEKFKGLIRRDTIGYVLDSFIAAIAIVIGVQINRRI